MVQTSSLELFLKKKQQEGFFSHYYLSFGSLVQNSSVTKYQDEQVEDLFDLASLTKALVTVPLVFSSFAKKTKKNVFSLSYGKWVGEKARLFHPLTQKLQLNKILQHSAGLPSWVNMWAQSCPSEALKGPVRRVFLIDRLNYYLSQNRALKEPIYSDVGFFLLGLGLELKTGQSLSQLFETYCKRILSLKTHNLFFKPSKNQSKKAVPTSYCPLRKRVLQGEVHDENCAAFGGEAGHAGLFGTGQGILQFLRAFVHTKEAERLFRWSGKNCSFGWARGNTQSIQSFAQGRSLGHFGFTGCAFWVDPKTLKFVIFLTNRVQHSRVTPEFFNIRKTVFEKIAESMSL